jgi:nucleoid-associated protein YgaU
MALKNPFKLEKLTITAYQDKKRKTQVGKPFKTMFNPESFSQKYAIEYAKEQGMNSTPKVNYARSKASLLSLKLLLDGTGSHEIGAITLKNALLGKDKTVEARIKHLLDICFRVNGKIHEPNYLVVTWGSLIFSCRLSSVDINYTSFTPDGKPLRAELGIDLLADQEVKKRLAQDALSSPDLTHSRIVKDGDTLPLLSKEIYGSSSHYLWIAEQNQLDDFRSLTSGQRLFFPPLVS